jgi:hypothetical protein
MSWRLTWHGFAPRFVRRLPRSGTKAAASTTRSTGSTQRTSTDFTAGGAAVYVALGEVLSFMRMPWSGSQPTLMDIHGAGAQPSDLTSGNPSDYPWGFGPQGDVRRIYNMVRLVRSEN